MFLDLEDEAVEPPDQQREIWLRVQRGNAGVLRGLDRNEVKAEMERDNPNKEKAITRAVGCYPYVSLYCASRCPGLTPSTTMSNLELIGLMAVSSPR